MQAKCTMVYNRIAARYLFHIQCSKCEFDFVCQCNYITCSLYISYGMQSSNNVGELCAHDHTHLFREYHVCHRDESGALQLHYMLIVHIIWYAKFQQCG